MLKVRSIRDLKIFLHFLSQQYMIRSNNMMFNQEP